MRMQNIRIGKVSSDAFLLTVIKLVTMIFGLATNRLLSEYLSVYDYGTYSQILLIASTVESVTIFGMMDAMNYFSCREFNIQKREAYIATIFSLQLIFGSVAGFVVMILKAPLCAYFENPELRRVFIFAAILPVLQNLLWILQVLIVSVGKANVLAIRNLAVSLIRLAAVLCVVMFFHNVFYFMAVVVVLDVAQMLFLFGVLRKNMCYIRLAKMDLHLIGEIFQFCAPMALSIIINSLNRNVDKYLVSLLTDTETLAMYTNASKQLPFDIIMSSFGTVLVPHIVRMLSMKKKSEAAQLCKFYLEISYIATGILCFAALSGAPQLMKFLYSNKYTSGISIFCVYILVDFFRFTNLTIILSSAGKSKLLMFLGLGTLVGNALLNGILFNNMGLIGPAVATLLVTGTSGLIMLHFDSKVLGSRISGLIDQKFFLLFITENLILMFVLRFFGKWMVELDVHYFLILVMLVGIHVVAMLLLNGRKLLTDLRVINSALE